MVRSIRLAFAAKIENLEAMFKSVREAAEAQGFDEKRVSQIQLAEALSQTPSYKWALS